MEKPTSNQAINENSTGDTTTPSHGGNSNSSCGSNNNIDRGCGSISPKTTTTAAKSSSSITNFPRSSTITTKVAKTTIPLPLRAPLPNVASSKPIAVASTSAAAAASTSSTLHQTTIPRFISNAAQQQQQQSQQQAINLSVNTTTGGNFDVPVDPSISVENLKKIIAKKLKVAKDRIRLLHRERELQDGSLKDNNLMDGSKIILIPNVETGLLAQRPENTVMQALESLNDSQVNDFLSGKTPLNLSMRLGDHMMLIQLQLSTVNPAGGGGAATGGGHNGNVGGSSCSSSRSRSSGQRTIRAGAVSGASSTLSHTHHHHYHHHHHRTNGSQMAAGQQTAQTAAASHTGHTTMTAQNNRSIPIAMLRKINGTPSSEAAQRICLGNSNSSSGGGAANNSTPSAMIKSSDLSSFLSRRDFESLQNIVKSIAMTQPSRLASAINASTSTNTLSAGHATTPAATSSTHGVRTAILPTKTNAAFTGGSSSSSDAAAAILEQSPIKSLSNLVSSSPIETTSAATSIKNIPITHGGTCAPAAATTTTVGTVVNNTNVPQTVSPIAIPIHSCQDPIAAKLTSCLCTRLNASSNSNGVTTTTSLKNCIESSCCLSRQDGVPAQRSAVLTTSTPIKTVGGTAASSSSSSSTISSQISSAAALLHKTANNPIVRSKPRHHHHHHHHHHHYHHHNNGSGGGNSTPLATRPKITHISPRPIALAALSNTSTASNDSGFTSDDAMLGTRTSAPAAAAATGTATSTTSQSSSSNGRNISSHSIDLDDSGVMTTDTRTLAEASRNLTQTLRKLSKEVFTNKIDLSSSEDTTRKGGSGAVIESMKNHGKGIYSGTFSGTLNPALQDRYGRPKRDISTVIHILNDLLSATPQYSRGARISFETPAAGSGSSSTVGNNMAAITNASRSKQIQAKHSHSHSHSHSLSCVKCIKAQGHFSQHSSSSNNSGINNNTAATSTIPITNGNNASNCAYGECNGHYSNNNSSSSHKTTLKSSHGGYVCCSGISSNNPADSSNISANDRKVCSCRYRTNTVGGEGGDGAATVERQREHTCQKCLSEMEMLRTKSKLDQIRLVMQQRKQKREARKLKGAPYGARVVGAETGAAAAATTTTTAAANIGNNTEINEAAKSATTVAAAAAVASTVDTAAAASIKNNGSANSSKTLTAAPPSEVSPNHIVEEVDTAA